MGYILGSSAHGNFVALSMRTYTYRPTMLYNPRLFDEKVFQAFQLLYRQDDF